MYADLHIHSCFSDGTQSPEEIVKTAKGKGISIISVCDHNSIGAYERLRPACDSEGLTLIQGVELDVVWEGRPLHFFGADNLHLLAYNFDPANNAMQDLIDNNQREYELAGIDMIKNMSKDYSNVSLEAYTAYVQPLGRGGWKSINYIYDLGICEDLLADGMKYVKQYTKRPKQFSSIRTACEIIQSAGGVPVLAHPGMYWQEAEPAEIFLELLNQGIGGLECYYPVHDEGFTAKCVEFCKEHNLCITCGCDSHGNFAQDIRGVFCDIGVIKPEISLLNLKGIL